MILYKCDSCGHSSVSEVFYCPVCHGEKFTQSDIQYAKVLMSLSLNATAAPYPEVYFVNFVEHNGTKLFCRSEKELEQGKSVMLVSDESGIVCY